MDRYAGDAYGLGRTMGLSFDGVDDEVSCANVLNVGTSDFSIAADFYINISSYGTTQTFLSKGNSVTTEAGYVMMFAPLSSIWLARIANGTTSVSLSPADTAYRNRRNVYAAMVVSFTSNQFSFYLNGVVAATGAMTGITEITTTVPLLFGIRTSGVAGKFVMRKTEVWASTALSSSDVLTHYREGNVSGVTASWDYNGIIGTTLVDTVGGFNGTVSGATIVNFDNPTAKG